MKNKKHSSFTKNNDLRVLIQVQAVGSAKIEWYAWTVWATPPPKKNKKTVLHSASEMVALSHFQECVPPIPPTDPKICIFFIPNVTGGQISRIVSSGY